MKKLVTATLCSTVLGITASTTGAFADSFDRPRFDKEAVQPHTPRPGKLAGVAIRKDLAYGCKDPMTDRRIPKRDCLAWISLILLRNIARDGGELSSPPMKIDQGSRQ